MDKFFKITERDSTVKTEIIAGLTTFFAMAYTHTFGIKTPWTLANEDVWRKTHKMGGILFCIMGILFVIGALIDNSHFIEFVLVPFLLGSIIFLYVYSYLVFRKIVLGK